MQFLDKLRSTLGVVNKLGVGANLDLFENETIPMNMGMPGR
jgi:hypothetical protein